MISKINFLNFKKGDRVIIKVSSENGEEIFLCKIIDISLINKLIHFEDNESEYECKFSEVKSIVRQRKTFPYGMLIVLYFVLFLFHGRNWWDNYLFPKKSTFCCSSYLSLFGYMAVFQDKK